MTHRERPRPEIGVVLPHARGAATARFARSAEALGFDRLVADGGPRGDALTTLAFAAAATGRIRLAPAGLSLPGRDVALVGRAARRLDELSEGRFALWVTAAPERPPLSLTAGTRRLHDGQLRELTGGPSAAVPLLVAAADRPALDRAGRHADGVVVGPDAGAYDVAGARTELERLWRAGDRGGRPQVVALVAVASLLDLPGRVDELAAAGATGIVLRPRPDDRLAELAAVLGLAASAGRD